MTWNVIAQNVPSHDVHTDNYNTFVWVVPNVSYKSAAKTKGYAIRIIAKHITPNFSNVPKGVCDISNRTFSVSKIIGRKMTDILIRSLMDFKDYLFPCYDKEQDVVVQIKNNGADVDLSRKHLKVTSYLSHGDEVTQYTRVLKVGTLKAGDVFDVTLNQPDKKYNMEKAGPYSFYFVSEIDGDYDNSNNELTEIFEQKQPDPPKVKAG